MVYVYVYVYILAEQTTNKMQVTFYVPETDREILEEFKKVCKEQGSSVSDTLVKHMTEDVNVSRLNKEIDENNAQATNKDA